MNGAGTHTAGDVVICGVDGSPAGFEALRQAIRLLPAGGELLAVTAYDPALAVHVGWDAPRLAEQIEREARATRERAASLLQAVPQATARMIVGEPAAVLADLARRRHASLLVVGTHGRRRSSGIALGGAATTLLHEAPCPLVVARPCAAPDSFPRTLAIGCDGSTPARRALLAATELSARFGVELHVVVATGGDDVDVDGLRSIARLEWDERQPVEALVAVSREVDLMVVGSRGLHGLRALGSVSERVAHQASSSVLVVRPAAVLRDDDEDSAELVPTMQRRAT